MHTAQIENKHIFFLIQIPRIGNKHTLWNTDFTGQCYILCNTDYKDRTRIHFLEYRLHYKTWNLTCTEKKQDMWIFLSCPYVIYGMENLYAHMQPVTKKSTFI